MAPPVPSGEQRRLLDAAADGNLDLFKSIASALAGEKGRIKEAVEAVRDRGAGALHVAAVHGRMQVCAYLVEEVQIDVNAADDKGDTPLTFALRGCTVEIVKYLLHHGADPNKPDEDGITALHVAAGEGMCEMIEVLLSKGADVNSFSKCGTPLYTAIIGEQVAAVKTLFDHHADCNKELAVYSAPLIAALEVRSLKCVELLIKAGADVKNANPLIVAANGGLNEFYKCLLGAGADPNDCDEGGQLPIEIAARNNRREDVEILFPVTSRIPYIPDWSIDGIIAYVKSEPKEEEHRVRSTTPGVHLLSSKKRYWDEKDQIVHEEFSRKFKVQRTVTGVTGKRTRDEDVATATAVAEEFCGGPQSFKKTRLEPTLEVVRSRDLWALQDNLRENIRHALPCQMFIRHIKHQPCSLHFHLRDGLYPSPEELIAMMSRSDIVRIKKFALVVDMEIEEAQMWEYVALASARLVEELQVEFVEATIFVFPLFGCNNSLKHLRLKHIHLPTYGLDIDPLGGVVFSGLAILELCAVRLADNGLTELMKLCPSAHTVRLIGMEYLKEITFPTLDKLRFIKLSRCRNATLVDVETLFGLQSFHYIGPLIEMYFHKNASLKELFMCFEGEKVTEDYSSGWLEGAPDFSRIRVLTVCSYSLNVMASGIVKNMNLESLTELQIIISALDEIVIADVYDFLMLPSSSLERLFLKLPESSSLGARRAQEIQRDDDGVELKKLALISVNGFNGSDNQMLLLEPVLAKAPKLEDLMLVCPRDKDGLEVKVHQLFGKCSEMANVCVKKKDDESSPRPLHTMPTSSAIDAE